MIILTYICKTYWQRNWEKYFWWKHFIFNIHCIIFSESEQSRAKPILKKIVVTAYQYLYTYIICVCVFVRGCLHQFNFTTFYDCTFESLNLNVQASFLPKHFDKDSFAWALIWILLFRQARRNAILVSIAANMGGNNLRLKHSRGGLSTSVNVIRAKWSGERGPQKEQRREKGAMPFKQVFTQRLGAESQTVGAQGWVTLLRAEEFFVI